MDSCENGNGFQEAENIRIIDLEPEPERIFSRPIESDRKKQSTFLQWRHWLLKDNEANDSPISEEIEPLVRRKLDIRQYLGLLGIRKALFASLLIVAVVWAYRAIYYGRISEDPLQLFLIVIVGIIAPSVLITYIYSLEGDR